MSACKSYKTCDNCKEEPHGEHPILMPPCLNSKCPMYQKNFCQQCLEEDNVWVKNAFICECGPPKSESESSSEEDENEDYTLCDCCMDNTKDDELCAPCFNEECKMFQKSFCPKCIEDTEDIDLCKCKKKEARGSDIAMLLKRVKALKEENRQLFRCLKFNDIDKKDFKEFLDSGE